jgi:hypothetical protein
MELYKPCTISWLTFLVDLLQVVGVMRIRFWMILTTAIVLGLLVVPANAEDKIQAYVNSYGRVVFTNLVDNMERKPEMNDVRAEGSPTPFGALVDKISANHGVDPMLIHAVIKTESNFNRWAVSRKGALGLMQLIPSTGRRYGVRDFFDPQQNIDGGVRYLKFLLEKFNGDLDLSLAAYNAGENLVERLGRVPAIPETMDYVRRIRAIYKGKAGAGTGQTPTAGMMAASSPEPAKVFRVVDSHGVVHFSNIEPPN